MGAGRTVALSVNTRTITTMMTMMITPVIRLATLEINVVIVTTRDHHHDDDHEMRSAPMLDFRKVPCP